ncbi:MAG TPA: excinuclease ABC subunit UvrA, partial [Burkholderiales bacterium]|nr:excinuclease ABC subunit UvrA [Burkholderiales bacterium]
MQKPDVEHIDGLSPAISIEQKTTSRNPRSTVATVTEIYDYMRLLWARVGVPYSPATGLPISAQTVSQMVDRVMALPEGTRAYLLAPVVRGRKGEYRKELAEWQKAGYTRVRIDGEMVAIEDAPALDKKFKHDIEVVVDRIAVRDGIQTRLADSFEQALKLAEGLAYVDLADGPVPGREEEGRGKNLKGAGLPPNRIVFSEKFACPVSGFTIESVEPRLFSFNAPQGACPACDGLGEKLLFDEQLVVPNEALSLKQGAIVPWAKSNPPSPYYMQVLASLAAEFGFALETPWAELPGEVRLIILHGTGGKPVPLTFQDGRKSYTVRKAFEGVIGNLTRRMLQTESAWMREELSKFQTAQPCETCEGKRLKPEALAVKVAGEDISTVTRFSVVAALDWFAQLPDRLTDQQRQIARAILKEIDERLGFLNNVGLDYLNLNRTSGTLSGGESQRIRLASQIGSGLTGVMYVLDEPSIGLHQRDNSRLLETLKRLRDLGNTVIVVEHDEDAILAADHVVDMGPGAGEHGGRLVAEGTPKQIMANAASLTGQYLSGKQQIPVPKKRRKPDPNKQLKLLGARGNNLKNATLDLPLGLLVCVTGVSGSGKSTLINDTLYAAVAQHLYGSAAEPAPHDQILGIEFFDKVINVDQSPIGRTPRSNPATYTGLFTPIRELFAGVPTARERGYGPGRFSFNVKGGRCEACQVDGVLKVEMHFLPDIYVPCDVCHGKRYNRETLDIQYKGRSIDQVLNMTVEQAHEFFNAVPVVERKLQTLLDVGLGYVQLGQSATTLSGGEAQRVKLSLELSKRDTGRTLYILDEPTTGLHFKDIDLLLSVLHALRNHGNTVVVIEHNLDVIKTADWVIDLGPEGGDGGGQIIAQGTPEDIADNPASFTGRYLREVLGKKKKAA